MEGKHDLDETLHVKHNNLVFRSYQGRPVYVVSTTTTTALVNKQPE